MATNCQGLMAELLDLILRRPLETLIGILSRGFSCILYYF